MSPADSSSGLSDARLAHKLLPVAVVVMPLLFGLFSLFLGKDVNWDLKNYHYYNAYAFVENRLDFDVAPAQLQTFINPVSDLPFYWLVTFFPDWVAGFVLGIVHGFNLSLVLLIYLKIAGHPKESKKLLYGICLAVFSGLAPGFISELGNTMHDNLTSLFVLWAVLILLAVSEKIENRQPGSGFLHIGMTGLVMGLGVGIKPSITIFAISSALVFAGMQPSWRTRLTSFVVYGIGGIAGGMISAGFWWWEMWKRFQNPFFPFYNHLFGSPYFTAEYINWSFYRPDHFGEYFLWPLIFSLDGSRVNQFPFLDVRFALLYILFIVWLAFIVLKKVQLVPRGSGRNDGMFDAKAGSSLLWFMLLSYVLWLIESATYRFIIPLELLAPLGFLILLEKLTGSRRRRTIVTVGAVVIVLALFRPFTWGRLEWNDRYFAVDTSGFDPAENAVVIMLGTSPMAFVVPEFPGNFRFVRPESNLFMRADKDDGVTSFAEDDDEFFVMIKHILDQHEGPVYILYNKDERGVRPEEGLVQLGINARLEECFPLEVNTPDRLEMCRVLK